MLVDSTTADQGWTLDNWQTAPYNRWTFHHLRDVVRTVRVLRSAGGATTLPQGRQLDLAAVPVSRAGQGASVAEIVERTYTDGCLVLHRGQVVVEVYPTGMAPDQAHVLMSVSKSIVGCVVAILADRGLVQIDGLVTDHVSALAASGYAGATVRDLLDMRTGIRFSEVYLDPAAEVRLLEQVIDWAPRTRPELPRSMYEWLSGLTAASGHGGRFDYKSCETDVLGWVCEAASGIRMPELLSDLIWDPLGTEDDLDAGVDSAGAVMHDGGLAASVRDMARFGQMLANGGRVGGQQVLPPWWIDDSLIGGPDSRTVFVSDEANSWLPGGMYRNQFWIPYDDRDALMCLGIHGQLVYVEPARQLVVVKLSSWPTPQDLGYLVDTLAAIDAIAAALES
jgi:CubicO group peptidase (beta-lactamase class C family)